jgi:hypothetical protein
MAIQKNFVVKNGIEVNDNLIFADKDQNTVGIGTTITPEKLQVGGGIGATSIVVTGVGTFPTVKSTNALISNGYINVGIVTTLSGTLSTYTTSNATTLNATTGNIVTGVVTSVSGTNLTYTTGNVTTLNVGNLNGVSGVVTSITGTGLTYTTGNFGTLNATTGNIVTGVVTSVSGTDLTYTSGNLGTLNVDNLFAVSGLTTNGTITNLTGTAATIGTVQISAGIITSSSGIVTYYGDGTYLNMASNPGMGIGIGTIGGVVGYGATFLDLRGAGVSTTFYDNIAGIATIFFEGGGGGGGAIGIGSTFPGTPLSIDPAPASGDLFFHIDYGRTFIYYDEVALGVGATAVWIDAAPFNQGISGALAGVAFSEGTASNPSAYFQGSSNTGWFSPTDGQFTVVSLGSSILNVNPSGIVVTGIASATNGFAGTFRGGIAVFQDTTTEPVVRITQLGTGNALVVEDSGNPDTTPFVITGIGSVGIGTNTPVTHLDVHGTIRAARQDAVSDGGEIVLARALDNANAWALDVHTNSFRVTDVIAGSTRVHIGSGGNVGLGSTATSKLHVFGDTTVTGVVTATTFVGNLTGHATTAGISTNLLGGTAGVNTTSAPTKLYVSGNAASNVVGLGTTDANTALNFSTGNNFSLTLTGSIVLSNPTGVTTGQSGIIQIQQDGVGGRTVGFGSHWDFPSATAPTLSTGANALDCITYFVRSSTSIIANSLIGIGTL